jgi:hypothetical protein
VSGLLASFGLDGGGVAAVVGAGGKTTLAYRLAAEANAAGLRVVVTTTTHMGTLPEATTGPVLVEEDGDPRPALADLVLVEADGARGRSLKAPADHEPVVPGSTTLLIVVAALDVLGAPLDEGRVHRPERVAAATGRAAGAPVDEAALAAALAWPQGYPARKPAAARAAVFLNKVEDAAGWDAAARLAARLVPPYVFVVAGSARSGDARRWP